MNESPPMPPLSATLSLPAPLATTALPAIQYCIFSEAELVVARLVDTISGSQLDRWFSLLREDPAYREGLPGLLDTREGRILLKPSEVLDIRRRPPVSPLNKPWAVLTSRPLTTALCLAETATWSDRGFSFAVADSLEIAGGILGRPVEPFLEQLVASTTTPRNQESVR